MTRFAQLSALTLALSLISGPGLTATKVGVAGAVVPQALSGASKAKLETIMVGDNIDQNMVIETGGNGRTQVIFVDGSSMNIGPSSQIIIDEFVFDPQALNGVLSAKLEKGSLRFIGGILSKREDQVNFDAMDVTVGIRGGMVNLDLNPTGELKAELLHGQLTLTTPQGNFEVNRIGTLVSRSSDGALSTRFVSSNELKSSLDEEAKQSSSDNEETAPATADPQPTTIGSQAEENGVSAAPETATSQELTNPVPDVDGTLKSDAANVKSEESTEDIKISLVTVFNRAKGDQEVISWTDDETGVETTAVLGREEETNYTGTTEIYKPDTTNRSSYLGWFRNEETGATEFRRVYVDDPSDTATSIGTGSAVAEDIAEADTAPSPQFWRLSLSGHAINADALDSNYDDTGYGDNFANGAWYAYSSAAMTDPNSDIPSATEVDENYIRYFPAGMETYDDANATITIGVGYENSDGTRIVSIRNGGQRTPIGEIDGLLSAIDTDYDLQRVEADSSGNPRDFHRPFTTIKDPTQSQFGSDKTIVLQKASEDENYSFTSNNFADLQNDAPSDITICDCNQVATGIWTLPVQAGTASYFAGLPTDRIYIQHKMHWAVGSPLDANTVNQLVGKKASFSGHVFGSVSRVATNSTETGFGTFEASIDFDAPNNAAKNKWKLNSFTSENFSLATDGGHSNGIEVSVRKGNEIGRYSSFNSELSVDGGVHGTISNLQTAGTFALNGTEGSDNDHYAISGSYAGKGTASNN